MTSVVHRALRTASAVRRPLIGARAAAHGRPHVHVLTRACDHAVLWGTAFLLMFATLAFGGTCDWVRYFVAMVGLGLAMTWALGALASDAPVGAIRVCTPAAYWGLLLVGLLTLPLVPLPPAVVRAMAPHTYTIYRQSLAGWPEQPPFAQLIAALNLDPAGVTPARLWRPLALIPYQTATTLYTAAAYAIVGAVVAFYPWRDQARKAVTHLLTVVIAVAAFEAMYGMLQQPSLTPNILWLACPSPVCLGTYANPDHYAGLLEMAFPLVLTRMLGGLWIDRRSPNTGDRTRLVERAALLYDPAIGRALSFGCLALLFVVAMAVSGCRSAFAATLLSLAVMVPLLPLPRRPAHLGAAMLAGGVFLVGLWATFPSLGAKLANRDVWDEMHLAGTRALIAADTVDMARDFPLTGIGLGSFSAAYPTYRARTARFEFPIEHAHNDYLEWVAEVGMPTAVVSFGMLIWLAWRVLRALRRARAVTSESLARWGCACAVLALLLHSCTDYNLHVPANALVFSVLLGALIRLTGSDPPPAQRSARRAGAVVVLAVGLGAACSLWGRWDTTAAFRRVVPDVPRNLAVAPRPVTDADALMFLQQAAAAAPAAAEVQYELGRRLIRPATDVGSSTADRDMAVRALLRSLWAAPLNPAALLDLGRAAAGFDGTAPEALCDLAAHAAALGRHDPVLQLDIAEWLLPYWRTFGGEARQRAGQQIQTALALAAPVPFLHTRWASLMDAYERIGHDQSGMRTHA